MTDLTKIKALTFDVGGTVFDFRDGFADAANPPIVISANMRRIFS